jgi:hypothetical protein
MKDDSLLTWLNLRLLVGYLGERAQGAWWPTAFYEPSSRFFLEPVFSKTARLAQYHGVLEAARRLHDDHLSVGSYHLFRLPEEIEQNLHALMEHQVREASTPPVPQNREAALAALQSLALPDAPSPNGAAADQDPVALTSREGPVAVGRIQHLHHPATLASIAAAYGAAFAQGTKTYPYLLG